jgi:transposase
VANAEHSKAVPGRKTDVTAAQWFARLLRHGRLRPSFIPDRPQRELRELTRFRTALTRDRARMVNRLHKTLEGANIKLAAVLTDLTGASGTRIHGLVRDQTPASPPSGGRAMTVIATPRWRPRQFGQSARVHLRGMAPGTSRTNRG